MSTGGSRRSANFSRDIALSEGRNVTRHHRLVGALIAAAIGGLCASLVALFGTLQPLEAASLGGGIVGAVVGAWLAPSLCGADRVKLVAVGGAAGVLVLPVAGLLSGFGGLAESVAEGRVPGIQDVPAVIAATLFYPLLSLVLGAPAVLVLLPAGLAWAVLTHRLIGRATVPSEPERTRDIAAR